MHLPINRNNLIYILFVFLCTLVFAFVIGATLLIVPDSITYHPIEKSKEVSAKSLGVAENTCAFDKYSDITDTGPFIIRYEGGAIYVFSEKDCLYRIKAEIENFPRADKNAVISGITAETRERLFELIQFMES